MYIVKTTNEMLMRYRTISRVHQQNEVNVILHYQSYKDNHLPCSDSCPRQHLRKSHNNTLPKRLRKGKRRSVCMCTKQFHHVIKYANRRSSFDQKNRGMEVLKVVLTLRNKCMSKLNASLKSNPGKNTESTTCPSI